MRNDQYAMSKAQGGPPCALATNCYLKGRYSGVKEFREDLEQRGHSVLNAIARFGEMAFNGFGLCVGGLLKPLTVFQHQGLLIAQMFLFALSAH
jgi:hypothetical protein